MIIEHGLELVLYIYLGTIEEPLCGRWYSVTF